MAVLPQLGGAQMRALVRDSGNGYYQQYNNCAGGMVSSAQSELTCNGGGGLVLPSRKRGREDVIEQFVSSSSALLPVPGMYKEVVQLSHPAVDPGRRRPAGGRRSRRRWRTRWCRSCAGMARRSTHWCGPSASACAPGWSTRASGNARSWRVSSPVPRRAGCARRRRSWTPRAAGTRTSRSGFGRRPRRARRGAAWHAATRPTPRGCAPHSTAYSSAACLPQRPPMRASASRTLAQPRWTTRSPAASATRPRWRAPNGRARRATSGMRRCCCCRAGTCACARRASPAWTPAPSASPPRTPPSTSSPTDRISRPPPSRRRSRRACLQLSS